jgi:hypothetical protein
MALVLDPICGAFVFLGGVIFPTKFPIFLVFGFLDRCYKYHSVKPSHSSWTLSPNPLLATTSNFTWHYYLLIRSFITGLLALFFLPIRCLFIYFLDQECSFFYLHFLFTFSSHFSPSPRAV